MAAEYTIIQTQPWTYLDRVGQVVNGFRVSFEITKFGEVHFIEVPSLAPTVVQAAINQLVSDRKNISTQ